MRFAHFQKVFIRCAAEISIFSFIEEKSENKKHISKQKQHKREKKPNEEECDWREAKEREKGYEEYFNSIAHN